MKGKKKGYPPKNEFEGGEFATNAMGVPNIRITPDAGKAAHDPLAKAPKMQPALGGGINTVLGSNELVNSGNVHFSPKTADADSRTRKISGPGSVKADVDYDKFTPGKE